MPTLWEDVRGDFPGTAGKVYLNAAATSLTPRPVREAVDRVPPRARGGRRPALGRLDGQARGGAPPRRAPHRRRPRRDRLRPQHLDRHEPHRRPARARRARAVGRARVPGGDASLDPPRRAGALRARGGGRPAPRVLRRGRGPALGHHRDQPRAVLERLPPGPRRVRPDQGEAAPRRLREPVARGLPGGRGGEPDRRARRPRATSGSARVTGPASATSARGCSRPAPRVRSAG